MTRIITALTFFIIVLVGNLNAQTILGDWTGSLKTPNNEIPVVFHISEGDIGLITTMDSPNQGALGIPTTTTTFENNQLTVTMKEKQMTYTGLLDGDNVMGTFTQGPNSTTLNLKRAADGENTVVSRPQDPKKPYPYISEDITFANPVAGGIKLAGTLTLPKNTSQSPVAILISGSGPQNRNSEILNHRSFLVISDYLTKNGIAVLRYDDRGVAQSEGAHSGATSADFATDVQAAVSYLKTRSDIDSSNIGLIGHSEGGLIAPMVASKDQNIAFVVLLAGTGVDGAEVLVTQIRRSAELNGTPKEILDANEDMMRNMYEVVKIKNSPEAARIGISEYINSYKENSPKNIFTASLTPQYIAQQAQTWSDPWMMYFIKTDPSQFLSKVDCPVLALNGSKDYQVMPDLNLGGIKIGLEKANNKDVTITELEGLNHLFQTAKTGSSREYGSIEETFSPEVLVIVRDWIIAKTE